MKLRRNGGGGGDVTAVTLPTIGIMKTCGNEFVFFCLKWRQFLGRIIFNQENLLWPLIS